MINATRTATASAVRQLKTRSNGVTSMAYSMTPTLSKSAAATSLLISPTAAFVGNRSFAWGIGGGLLLAGLHSATGSSNDFYDYRFESHKDPDDLASFYGGEEFMELFCILPIVGKIMMRNGRFDDEGNVITTGIPGQMKVSMVFSDEMNDNTGETDWFNKRERFRNSLFGYTCWDMVSNFGFRTLEDGTRECYHFGEYFHGNLPVVSQIVLLVFKIHARWVAWATEHHINRYAFTSGMDDEEEEMEEQSRANMPLFLLKNYAPSDLMAMVFGYDHEDDSKEKQPSFLVTGRGESEEGEEEDKNKLPFQQKDIRIQISKDILDDKRVMKELLARDNTRGSEDVKAVLVRRHTLALRRRTGRVATEGDEGVTVPEEEGLATKDVYALASDLAVDRAQMRRMTRRRTPGQDAEEGPLK